MKLIRIFCILGFVGSLIVWLIPAKLKPYHIRKDLDDYKILLVFHDSEYGFASDGIVRVHTSQGFGGTREALAPIRKNWINTVARSREHWPTNSRRVFYDEWGPIHLSHETGVEETQVGLVYCIPYSLMMIGFASLYGIIRWLSRPRVLAVPDLSNPSHGKTFQGEREGAK